MSDPPHTQLARSSDPESDFVGRDRALARLRQLFERGERLVTIVGGPGLGKSRLAREHTALDNHAVVCSVADVHTELQLDAALCRAMDTVVTYGLTDVRDSTRLLQQQGQIVLVLDNCEQVIEPLALAVTEWLEHVPGLRLLLTSRTPLGLAREIVSPLDALDEASSIELLCGRARRHRSDFGIGVDASRVAELANRLGGIPLALELCAARACTRSVPQLLSGLARRFELLADEHVESHTRHTSLEIAILSSWDALTELEQSVLTQCAVFRGGFTADAATACIAELAELPNLLTRLLATSLLVVMPGGSPGAPERFELYESVREFVLSRVVSEGLLAGYYRRHASYFLRFAERHREPGAMSVVAPESENLLAVVERFRHRDPRVSVGAVLHLELLLAARGPYSQHLALLDAGLESLTGRSENELCVQLLLGRALLMRRQGRVRAALADAERAVAYCDSIRSASLAARAHAMHGETLCLVGDPHRGLDMLDRALERHRSAGDRWGEAQTLGSVGHLHRLRGMHQEEERCVLQALSLFEDLGDPDYVARYRTWYGRVLHGRGDLDGAQACFSTAQREASRERQTITWAMNEVAWALLEHERGQLCDARSRLTGLGASVRRVAAPLVASNVDLVLAGVLHSAGELDGARQLLLPWIGTLETEGPSGAYQQAYVFAQLAALAADGGDVAAAEDYLAHAKLLATGIPLAHTIVEILSGICEVARARESSSPASRTLVATAQRRLAVAGAESATARVCRRQLTATLLNYAACDHDDVTGRPFVVGPDAAWFVTPMQPRVELARHAVLRRLMLTLAQRRLSNPGASVTRAELTTTLWPGANTPERKKTERLWVAASRLRKLGLTELLLKTHDGYMLDPDLPFRMELDS